MAGQIDQIGLLAPARQIVKLDPEVPHFCNCSLMQRCVRLHRRVMLENINCLDWYITYQSAAAQSKKERRDCCGSIVAFLTFA
jgi:hypothetical protein